MTRIPLKVLAVLCVACAGVLLVLGFSAVVLCSASWCPNYSLAKIRNARDFDSCSALQFPVEPTHPPRCIAGHRVFYGGSGSRLRVVSPLGHSRIALPLTIAGSVRIGSGTQLRYQVFDRDGHELTGDDIPLPRALSGQTVPFRAEVSYPRSLGTGGTLAVFLTQGREKGEEVRIPVIFAHVAYAEVKAYFGNTERDPGGQACDVAYPVARRVSIAEELPAAALRELLHGPTHTERRQSFTTGIPDGVTVRSLVIRNGRATVSFSPALPGGSGATCRMQGIRAQIERTLKQFPHIVDVIVP